MDGWQPQTQLMAASDWRVPAAAAAYSSCKLGQHFTHLSSCFNVNYYFCNQHKRTQLKQQRPSRDCSSAASTSLVGSAFCINCSASLIFSCHIITVQWALATDDLWKKREQIAKNSCHVVFNISSYIQVIQLCQ